MEKIREKKFSGLLGAPQDPWIHNPKIMKNAFLYTFDVSFFYAFDGEFLGLKKTDPLTFFFQNWSVNETGMQDFFQLSKKNVVEVMMCSFVPEKHTKI